MNKPKACILVVDDEKVLVDSIEALFRYCGFEVIKATDPERALALSDEIKPDVIIADIRMPKLDGITLLKKFKAVQPEVKVITMTGYYSDYMKSIKQAIDSGLIDRVIQNLVDNAIKSTKESNLAASLKP
jgi:DNA-binding NtrC family response regulator